VGYPRKRPKRLALKLLLIRQALGLSQREMVKRLGADILPNCISKYEHDHNEPPTDVLLVYARLVRVPLEQLVDDEMELTISHKRHK
jgi:transcriptional regulator with XRE-family HTH domain